MTASTVIAIDTEVRIVEHKTYTNQCGVVVAIDKGWYSVDLNDTDEEVIVKVRAKALEIWVEETDEPKTMHDTLAKYRKTYVTTYTARNNKSQSSPKSVVAKYMEGFDHAQVAQFTSSLLGSSMDMLEFYHQYSHLNNGQMRMNCGNRINAAVKRGDIIEGDVEAIVGQWREGSIELQSAETLDKIYRPERLPKTK